jgi:DNA-directed RNA polymerase specialized sigma24 family protein
MVAIHSGWTSRTPPPRTTDPDDEVEVFASAFNALPKHYRDTLRCRSEGHGITVCGARLGVDPATIQSRHQRVLRRLSGGTYGGRGDAIFSRVMYLLGRYDATHEVQT